MKQFYIGEMVEYRERLFYLDEDEPFSYAYRTVIGHITSLDNFKSIGSTIYVRIVALDALSWIAITHEDDGAIQRVEKAI